MLAVLLMPFRETFIIFCSKFTSCNKPASNAIKFLILNHLDNVGDFANGARNREASGFVQVANEKWNSPKQSVDGKEKA